MTAVELLQQHPMCANCPAIAVIVVIVLGEPMPLCWQHYATWRAQPLSEGGKARGLARILRRSARNPCLQTRDDLSRRFNRKSS